MKSISLYLHSLLRLLLSLLVIGTLTGTPQLACADDAPPDVAGNLDADGDATPNFDDPDIDGDGTNNASDSDIDGDGIANEQDPDDDDNGVFDAC